jgi:hypothetical protein
MIASLALILSTLQGGFSAGVAARATAVPAESLAVVKAARRAQADFEGARRTRLPVSMEGSGGRCDVRIGRFCYWHDDAEYNGPEEPKSIAEARERLLGKLAAAAARVPGDGWIAGQRVRYLIEQQRDSEAVSVAAACTADRWWCHALAGFALHTGGDYAGAEQAYDSALHAMPEELRCRWTDIADLLDDKTASRYRKLSCVGRGEIEARFWALARPLYMLPGNDVRTEHFARYTMTRLESDGRSPQGMSWGDDMRELMVRYGWPTRWSREAPNIGMMGDIRVIGHEPTPSFDFAPTAHALDAPIAAAPDDWLLTDHLAQTRYAPRYTKAVAALSHQAAYFRRGDSALVVVAFDSRRDTAFTGDSVQAAVALAWAVPDSFAIARKATAGRRDVLTVPTQWRPLLLSVEARDSAARRAARARLGIRPPGDSAPAPISISDLLLFDVGAQLPTTLDDALGSARGTLRARADQPAGVYWEVYGVGGDSLEFSLMVVREGESWMHRAARSLGMASRQAPVHMRWTDPPARVTGTVPRALAVDLSTLPAGRYRMVLTVTAPGQPPASAERTIEVER